MAKRALFASIDAYPFVDLDLEGCSSVASAWAGMRATRLDLQRSSIRIISDSTKNIVATHLGGTGANEPRQIFT